jgi:hypothetical protein
MLRLAWMRVRLVLVLAWLALGSLALPLVQTVGDVVRACDWYNWRAYATQRAYEWLVHGSILVKKITQNISNEAWLPEWARDACRLMNRQAGGNGSDSSSSSSNVRARVLAAFGSVECVAQHFANVDYAHDVGGGCIASVHRATLADTQRTEVCLKVFYAGVQESTRASLARAQPLCDRMCACFPDADARLLLGARWQHLAYGLLQQVRGNTR